MTLSRVSRSSPIELAPRDAAFALWTESAGVGTVAPRVQAAVMALGGGDRRAILGLARDDPSVLDALARRLGLSLEAVSRRLSELHMGEYEEQYDAVVSRYDVALLGAAQLEAESHVLDVGCGSGASTRQAARVAVSGSVVGIDISAPLVNRGRQRSRVEGLANTRFVLGDVQVQPFEPASFDAAISRFGAMYFHDPVAAFSKVEAALRPGGRLALLSWQPLRKNEWMLAIRNALALGRTLPEPRLGAPGAFGLADKRAVRRILSDSGFTDVSVSGVHESVNLGPDADRAFDFVSTLGFTSEMLDGLNLAGRRRALERLRDALLAHESDGGVLFESGAWLTTARRTSLPSGAARFA